jgi:hypothetical protein
VFFSVHFFGFFSNPKTKNPRPPPQLIENPRLD